MLNIRLPNSKTALPIWTYWLLFIISMTSVCLFAMGVRPNFQSILPITAAVAIAIFVLREILEHNRKKSAMHRRLHAIKRLMAAEMERNHWVLRSTNNIIKDINDGYVSIDHSLENSMHRIKFVKASGFSSSVLFPVHLKEITSHMLEIATIDGQLFEKMESSYDSMLEVAHAHEVLINEIDQINKGQAAAKVFTPYAESACRDAHQCLEDLYLACTGKKLERWRIR